MGVEPTVACSAQPTTSFEDWGAHRDTTTPRPILPYFGALLTWKQSESTAHEKGLNSGSIFDIRRWFG